MRRDYSHFLPLISILLLFSELSYGQAWSGILSSSRAVDWTQAGLPGDIPPDLAAGTSWTQCGSTINPSGTTLTTINNAISSCASAHPLSGPGGIVVLGPGTFNIAGGVMMQNNVVLRGQGASSTKIHWTSSGGCNGKSGGICVEGSNTYGGDNGGCTVAYTWPCPAEDSHVVVGGYAEWTGGYSRGSTQITLSNVSGIVVNQTPIVLDQCDLGFSGRTGTFACGAPSSGNAGAVVSATVASGGSGWSVGNTFTISRATNAEGPYSYGSATATGSVTAVRGGTVTSVNITNGGFGYIPTNGASTSGGAGSGLTLNLTVGSYDGGSIFPNGMAVVGASEGPAGESLNAREQAEVVLATNITGSGPYTVTINRPIEHANWSSGQGPKAWWGSSTMQNVGVENMTLDQSAVGSMSAVAINTTSFWWIVGVASNVANFMHIRPWITSNGLISNGYYYETQNHGTTSYGIGAETWTGGLLVENNIMQGIVDPVSTNGACSACVFAYNFMVNEDYRSAPTIEFAAIPSHATDTDYILYEGNIGNTVNLDQVHGPHFLNTILRNYLTGYDANNGTIPNQTTVPIALNAYSRFNNVIGNVMGTSGYHTNYQCIPTSSSQSQCTTNNANTSIYDLGWSHTTQLDYGQTPPLPNDTATAPSTMRWGNYDVINRAVQWNSSEVPSGATYYPNSVPASHAIASSFYNGVTKAYFSCGTGLVFWNNPTTGTCPPYPPIGPDVSNGDIGMCTSGTYRWARVLTKSQCAGGTFTASTNGGFGNSNPAMRCYLNQMSGTPNGTGVFNINFNAAACYAKDTASTRPAPPTRLSDVVK